MSESHRTVRIDSEPEVLTDDNIPDHWTAITTTPLSPPPPMKPETAHAILHWSACRDDDCLIHQSSKRDSGHYPQQQSSRRSKGKKPQNHQKCNCKEPHPTPLNYIIHDKNLDPRKACLAWKKGKRVCWDCECLVNPVDHAARCTGRTQETTPETTNEPADEPVTNDDNQENRDPAHNSTPELAELLAQVHQIQQTTIDTVNRVERAFHQGRYLINHTLTRQAANQENLRTMTDDISRIDRSQQVLAQQLNQLRQFRVGRPTNNQRFRDNRAGLVGASAYRRGLMSQTTCDMLLGAGYATAAWWILGVTMIAISYVNRKGE